MKKSALAINLLLVFLIVTGCATNVGQATPKTPPNEKVTTDWKPTTYNTVNNFQGVTMTVKKGTPSNTGLTVVFENHSSSQCIYGTYFWLEEKINGSWYQLPNTPSDYGRNFDIGFNLYWGNA